MQFTVTSIRKMNKHMEVIGDAGDDGGAMVHLPISYAKGLQIDGKLLVAVDKSGLLGWLKRRVLSL